MTAEPSKLPPTPPEKLYQEGIVAGGIGAATMAIWFLLWDAIQGRPLHTPTVLGTALFRWGEGFGSPESLSHNLQMVLMCTWVHGLTFCAIGGMAARLLGWVEENQNLGFGALLLVVIFMYGFIFVFSLFAEQVLQALTLPAILVGNLLAAAAMGAYFWRRHPSLTMRP